jgi:arylsulfatase A-like enzyme
MMATPTPAGPRSPARPWVLWTLLLLGLAAGACGGSEPSELDRPETTAARANVVFVLSDALRASSLELYGYPRSTAPNLTALAGESLVFEDHLVSYPATPGSVSQMFTGRFRSPHLMRATYLHAPVRAVGDDLLVLPRELRAAGYRTGIVTSHPWWHDAPALEWFDHQALLEPPGERPYAPIDAFSEPVRELLDRFGAVGGDDGESAPFFLYVHSLDTHGPLYPHEGLTPPPSDEYPRIYDLYDGEIRFTDRWLGWLIDELRRRGLLDDTLFVLTSDHGEELGEMGPGAWNWSHGFTLRRAQLHVPLVIRLPGGRVTGRVAETTRHLDLAPTLVELLLGPEAGLDRFRLDGRSLADRIGGNRPGGWRPAGPDEPPVPTPAFNERYRSLHRGDLALHHDLWTGRYETYRAVPDDRNYPRDQPVKEAELPAGFRRELDRFHRRSLREYYELPPAPMPSSPMIVGVPGPVPGTATGEVTYEAEPADGLWTLSPFHYLTAGADEVPAPIEVAMPWIPGSYQVAIRLARPPEGRVSLAPFRIEILGADAAPVEIDPGTLEGEGADTDERDGVYAELGTHRIGPFFRARITAPEGRVVIRGFRFTPLDAEGRPAEPDPDLEKRLRALGYVD